MSKLVLCRVVAAAVQVSRRAARLIREVKVSGSLGIKEKEKDDYVTIADFKSQLCIVKSLSTMFPKLKFYGEEGEGGTLTPGKLESEFNDIETKTDDDVLVLANDDTLESKYSEIKEEDLVVWIDPLDGTREFTQGPEVAHQVTILIGISWKGEPIAGIVNQPFYKEKLDDENGDRVFWGITGLGAYVKAAKEDEKYKKLIKSDNSIKPNGNYTLVTTRSHLSKEIMDCLNGIPNVHIEHYGGSGYKTIKVIEGDATCYFYPSSGTKRWDTCAVEAILKAIGGQFTDIFGEKYDYSFPKTNSKPEIENVRGLIASMDHHDHFTKHVTEDVKNKFRSKM